GGVAGVGLARVLGWGEVVVDGADEAGPLQPRARPVVAAMAEPQAEVAPGPLGAGARQPAVVPDEADEGGVEGLGERRGQAGAALGGGQRREGPPRPGPPPGGRGGAPHPDHPPPGPAAGRARGPPPPPPPPPRRPRRAP